MQFTKDMMNALYCVNETNKWIFVTGKAGTGKTTLLRHLVDNSKKRTVIASPTGIAAVNAGGCTLHSLFRIPLDIHSILHPMKGNGLTIPMVNLYSSIDVLIIDEISMVRPDILDYIDRKLRLARMNDEPMGGVQLVMFGDLFQLPPVLGKDEQEKIQELYRGGYFFYANVFQKKGFDVIELDKVFRQKDKRFINILNDIREYKLTNREIEELDEIRNKPESANLGNGYVHLCSLKKDVSTINSSMMGEPTMIYEAMLLGNISASSVRCEMSLGLRIGARVMTIVNDKAGLYYNGSTGYVEGLEQKSVRVRFDDGHVVEIFPYTWEAHDYKVNKAGEIVKTVKGSITQIPILPAWAITIHKSQGLTFDKVVLHVKRMFSPGQLYVALSRCTSLSGLITDGFIDRRYIRKDKDILSFTQTYRKNGYVFNKNVFNKMRVL